MAVSLRDEGTNAISGITPNVGLSNESLAQLIDAITSVQDYLTDTVCIKKSTSAMEQLQEAMYNKK